MPELNLRNIRRDFRLPELRLPEMSRDDIAKALGEARKELREVRRDLQDMRRDFELPKVEAPSADAPRVDMAKVADGAKQVADGAKQAAEDARKSVMQAAQSAGLVRAPFADRARRPLLLAGIVTIGVVGFAVLNSPTVKTRLRDSAQRARERMAARRAAWDLEDETSTFDTARPAAVASTYSGVTGSAGSPYVERPLDRPETSVHRIEEDAPARA